MKFIEIIEHAKKLDYRIEQEEYYSNLILVKEHKFEIKIVIPNDRIKQDLSDSVNVDWEYSITNQLENKKVHSEWFDYYQGNAETKIHDMQIDILKYLDNFAGKKINVVDKSVINLLGIKFLKYKELEFE